MWKKQGDKFIKVAGPDLGQTEEALPGWLCHVCKSSPNEYKLVSESRGRFGFYCRSCIDKSYVLCLYGKSNEETIKNAI